MFNYLTVARSSKESESFITKAFECRGATDPVAFQDCIQAQAVAQHLGLLTHLRGWQYAKCNALQKCVKSLWIDEPCKVHPSCGKPAPGDKSDPMYAKAN
mmetsp:Transcript_20588/g.31397  ORF Transcript_20588/g.31397 Transcript_20588/m.31397 type:complete len:100 (-) Transcript_20588:1944-2243(-)